MILRSRKPGSCGWSSSNTTFGWACSSWKAASRTSGDRMTILPISGDSRSSRNTSVRSRLAAAVPDGMQRKMVLPLAMERLGGALQLRASVLAEPGERLAQPVLQRHLLAPAEHPLGPLVGQPDVLLVL